jgi:hypothetical protein
VIRKPNYIPLDAREQERVLTHYGNQAAATGNPEWLFSDLAPRDKLIAKE